MFKIKFRILRFFVISYLVLIIQSSLIGSIALGSLVPDLGLCLVVFFGLYNGRKQGMIYGIILGFCTDILSGGIVGINSFIMGCVGSFAGLLKERVYTEHLLTKILVVFIAGLFSTFVYYLLALNFYSLPDFFENWMMITGVIIYTTLCNVLLFNIFEKIIIIKQMTVQ